jgi:hypothetical protein
MKKEPPRRFLKNDPAAFLRNGGACCQQKSLEKKSFFSSKNLARDAAPCYSFPVTTKKHMTATTTTTTANLTSAEQAELAQAHHARMIDARHGGWSQSIANFQKWEKGFSARVAARLQKEASATITLSDSFQPRVNQRVEFRDEWGQKMGHFTARRYACGGWEIAYRDRLMDRCFVNTKEVEIVRLWPAAY